jgi:hypothetical protein
MVTMNIDLGQFLLSFMVTAQVVTRQTAQAIAERLAQGASPEDLLREWSEAAKGTPQDEGFQHLFEAVAYLRQSKWDQALAELGESREKLPDMAPFLRFTEAMILTQLRDYERAFAVYKESAAGMLPQLELVNHSLPQVQELEREVYQRWALTGIGQGLEGLFAAQSKTLASGLNKLSEVFIEARTAGHESSIWEFLDTVAQALPQDTQPQMDVFQTAVRMIAESGPEWIEALAQVYTTGSGPAAGTPARQVADSLRGLVWPDAEFANDLEAVQASQPMMEEPKWSD